MNFFIIKYLKFVSTTKLYECWLKYARYLSRKSSILNNDFISLANPFHRLTAQTGKPRVRSMLGWNNIKYFSR